MATQRILSFLLKSLLSAFIKWHFHLAWQQLIKVFLDEKVNIEISDELIYIFMDGPKA